MTNFKLKITIGEATIELEGEGHLVKDILVNLKETGLGNLTKTDFPAINNARSIEQSNVTCTEQKTNTGETRNESFNIKDLIISEKLCNDQEKILASVYHCFCNGAQVVKEDDIRGNLKELNLWTNSFGANFKTNIKKLIRDKKYLSSYGDNSYIITNCGQEQMKSIINSENNSAKKQNNKIAKNSLPKYEFINLDLTKEEKINIVNIFANKNLNNIDKVLLAAYWNKTFKKESCINKDIVFSILKNANTSVAFSIKDAISNAKKKNYFFSTENKGEFEISHIGEEHVESNLLTQG